MTKLFYEIHYYDRKTGVDSLLEEGVRKETTYGITDFEFSVVRNVGEDEEQGYIIWEQDDDSRYGIKETDVEDSDDGYYYVIFLEGEGEDKKIISKAYYYYDPDSDSIVSDIDF